jgi:hypothetical protein
MKHIIRLIVLQLKWLGASLRPLRPNSGHVGIVVDKMAFSPRSLVYPVNPYASNCSIFISYPITDATKPRYCQRR